MNFRNAALLLLILSSHTVNAADSTFNWAAWKMKWPKEVLNMKYIEQQAENNMISEIEVLDMRCDTSCLGLYTNRSHVPYRVVTELPLQTWLNTKLANSKQGQHLLMVIKDFWINETTVALDRDKKPITNFNTQAVKYYNTSGTKLKCNIDVFVKTDDQYQALVRMDTTLTHLAKVKTGDELLVDNLLFLLNKKITTSILQNRFTTKKKGTKESITENYNRAYQLAVLTDSFIKPGIYYSWEQFKNNQPDTRPFRIQKNKTEPPTLYLKDEQGLEAPTRDVFAISDGKQVYKVQEGFVFNIYRNSHSIYWMGVESFDIKTKTIPIFVLLPGAYGFGTEAIGTDVKVQLSPYLMNLETGKQY